MGVNLTLHAVVASRVLEQASLMRSATGNRRGLSLVMGVFCEIIAEVDGIAYVLATSLKRRGCEKGFYEVGLMRVNPSGLDDVANLDFYSWAAAANGTSVGPDSGGTNGSGGVGGGSFHGSTRWGSDMTSPSIAAVLRGHATEQAAALEERIPVPLNSVRGADGDEDGNGVKWEVSGWMRCFTRDWSEA